MGGHSSLRHDVAELMDVVVADLDGGSIHVPDTASVPLMPEPLYSQVARPHRPNSVTVR